MALTTKLQWLCEIHVTKYDFIEFQNYWLLDMTGN